MKDKILRDGWLFEKEYKKDTVKEISIPYDAMIRERRIDGLHAGETSGYYPGGIYRYTRKFVTEPGWNEGSVVLDFEGISGLSEIMMNGKKIAEHHNSFTEFLVPVSELNPEGQENELSVRVDHSHTPDCRWYTGSGIYRDVHILWGPRAHIEPYGLSVRTERVDSETGEALLQVTICVSSDAVEKNHLLDLQVFPEYDGQKDVSPVSETPCSHTRVHVQATECAVKIKVPKAELWDADHPFLYRLKVQLYSNASEDSENMNSEIIDEDEIVFGIRTLKWDSERGLLINGKREVLRGAAIHLDNGPLGAEEYASAAYRKVTLLKECGHNAIRIGHCPAGHYLLDACDHLGMYVMNEFSDVWRGSKNPFDYALFFDEDHEADLASMVRIDRNHPSVIIRSIGNEVYDTAYEEGAKTATMLCSELRKLDNSRPITCCVNILSGLSMPADKPIPDPLGDIEAFVDPYSLGGQAALIASKRMNVLSTVFPFLQGIVKAPQLQKNTGSFFEAMDIIGLNYGTHLNGTLNSELYVHSETYPKRLGNSWKTTCRIPNAVGDFLWTGWDYIGETGIGTPDYGRPVFRVVKPYPYCTAGTGSIDLSGDIGAQGRMSAVIYGKETNPVIAVSPYDKKGMRCLTGAWRSTDALLSWSFDDMALREPADWKRNIPLRIEVYSKAPQVELFLNGQTLGRKVPINGLAIWRCPWRMGVLKAVAYDAWGQETGESTLQSAGKQSLLSLHRQAGSKVMSDALIFLDISLVDENGNRRMRHLNNVKVSVENGELICLNSADPKTDARIEGEYINLYYGHALAVVRKTSADPVKVKAESDDPEVKTASIQIEN